MKYPNKKRERDKALKEYKDQHPDLSLKEIGVVFGITKGRVSQILKRKERDQ